MNEREERFGCRGLDRAIPELAQERAEAIKVGILERLRVFLGDVEPQDDLTLVVVRRQD